MNTFSLSMVLIVLAALPMLSQFVLYPLFLALVSRLSGKEQQQEIASLPSVDMIIAVRNGERLIADKLNNCLALQYPSELLNFVVVSDGSTDKTTTMIEQFNHARITLLESPEHIGKAKALNLGVSQSNSEVLVFSDADAMLGKDAIEVLIKKMLGVGAAGVCGQRVITKAEETAHNPQQKYIDMDSWLKTQESRLGFLTSNDGKLYAVLRQYFNPIAEGVSDDLFSALNIMSQKQGFVFEPQAKAFIAKPSRNIEHEVLRRRRITCRSLNNYRIYGQILNPFRYGILALALIANKIMRRCLPFSLVLLFIATLALIKQHEMFFILMIAQLFFYAVAALVYWNKPKNNGITKWGYLVLYFVAGNIGMFLGVVDFIANKKVIKWEPVKND